MLLARAVECSSPITALPRHLHVMHTQSRACLILRMALRVQRYYAKDTDPPCCWIEDKPGTLLNSCVCVCVCVCVHMYVWCCLCTHTYGIYRLCLFTRIDIYRNSFFTHMDTRWLLHYTHGYIQALTFYTYGYAQALFFMYYASNRHTCC